MRWVGTFVGVTAALLGCATSESNVGGGVLTGGTGGLEGGLAGTSAGGVAGSTGGTAGVASGGVAGAAGAATGGVAGGGSGGTGATGGTGGGPCTPPVAGGACDTFPQCGCPVGQACDVVTLTGVTQCMLAGNVAPYNACDGSATKCQVGYACVGGACKSFCDTTANCTATNGECLQVTYTDTAGLPQPIPQMKICSKTCLLENPSAACGPTLSCYLTDQALGKTDCAKAGTAIGPANCSADNTICSVGYVCLTSNECRKWCRIGFPTDCAVGKACSPFGTPLIVGGTQYGVCAL